MALDHTPLVDKLAKGGIRWLPNKCELTLWRECQGLLRLGEVAPQSDQLASMG